MNSQETTEPVSRAMARRRPWFRDPLAWALVGAGVLMQAYAFWHVMQRTGGQPGFPLDDAYIHMNFARSLLRGEGFAYNPGEPQPGSTSPGWTALLAIAAMNEDRLVGAAMALSLFFYLASGIAIFSLALDLKLSRGFSFFAALMTLECGRLVWAGQSGMEMGAFAFLLLCGVRRHLRDRRRGGPGAFSALLFGLAACFRPEGYLVYAIFLFDHALDQWIEFDADTRQFHFVRRPFPWRRWAVAIGIFLVCIAPYMLFCLSTTGRIFPNTYYVKSNGTYTVFMYVYYLKLYESLADTQTALILFFAPGVVGMMAASYRNVAWRWREAARARILWLFPLGLFVGQSILSPTNLTQFGRYIMPILPILFLVSAIGVGLIVDCLPLRAARARNVFAAYAILVVLAGIPIEVHAWSKVLAQSVDNINSQQVVIGRWLKENTPADALIASHDAGAIPYYGERRFVDTLGLVTSEVMEIIDAHRDIGALDSPYVTDYIREIKPDYVVSYDAWFSLCTYHFEAFEMVKEVDLGDENLVCGDPVMHVWKSNWENYDPRVDEWMDRFQFGYDYGYGYGDEYGYGQGDGGGQTMAEDSITSPLTDFDIWLRQLRGRRQDLDKE